MQELTVEDLVELHRLGIERYGGRGDHIPATLPGLSSALYSASYNEGLLGYAAGLLCYIGRAQLFIDGSKRCAWLACVRVLELNGFYLDVETAVATAFMEHIVVARLEPADIAEWLAMWLEVIE